MHLRCSRKTLIYLILTLNHTYPDYDFSLLRAHHFRKEASVKAIEETVASALLEVSRVRPPGRMHPADLHVACSLALDLQCFRAAHASCQVSCCICAQIWDSMPGYSDCSFADSLWSAMDEAICLPECDVYSYKSDGEDDPFGAFT